MWWGGAGGEVGSDLLPSRCIKRRGGVGIPALEAAISSQGEGPAATGYNGNDTSIMGTELLLPTVLVHSYSPICQTHPDVGADGGHRSNAGASLLQQRAH